MYLKLSYVPQLNAITFILYPKKVIFLFFYKCNFDDKSIKTNLTSNEEKFSRSIKSLIEKSSLPFENCHQSDRPKDCFTGQSEALKRKHARAQQRKTKWKMR